LLVFLFLGKDTSSVPQIQKGTFSFDVLHHVPSGG
jgi:hypothetical protein